MNIVPCFLGTITYHRNEGHNLIGQFTEEGKTWDSVYEERCVGQGGIAELCFFNDLTETGNIQYSFYVVICLINQEIGSREWLQETVLQNVTINQMERK